VASSLPQPKSNTGRPSYSNTELLPGIIKVLRSGMRWRDLDNPFFPSDVTHWRRLRYWERKLGFIHLLDYVLNLLLGEDILKPKNVSIDGTLIPSFKFEELTSYSGKHHLTGTKVSLTVDSNGLPLSSLLDIGSRHDSPLALPTIELIPDFVFEKIDEIFADKGYVGGFFREQLSLVGIKANVPQRGSVITQPERDKFGEEYVRKKQRERRKEAQTNHSKRYVVERTNAWIKNNRRLSFRYDYTVLSFKAFLNLALTVMLVKKLIN
jgi:transposase